MSAAVQAGAPAAGSPRSVGGVRDFGGLHPAIRPRGWGPAAPVIHGPARIEASLASNSALSSSIFSTQTAVP